MKTTKLYPVSLNEKGLRSLRVWLCRLAMPINSKALQAWEAEAMRHASIDNNTLYDCAIEHGTWSTKIYSLGFDITEVRTIDDSEGK